MVNKRNGLLGWWLLILGLLLYGLTAGTGEAAPVYPASDSDLIPETCFLICADDEDDEILSGSSGEEDADSEKRRGDNRDDPHSGMIDRIGDGNSGQGDDLHRQPTRHHPRPHRPRPHHPPILDREPFEIFLSLYNIEIAIPSCCDKNHFYYGVDFDTPIRVIVTDRKGNGVSGLAASDFVVSINGIEQSVDFAEQSPGVYEGILDISFLGINYAGYEVTVAVKKGFKRSRNKVTSDARPFPTLYLGKGTGVLKIVGPGDINADHAVDILDLNLMAASWFAMLGCIEFNPDADLNHDHIVKDHGGPDSDLVILLAFWGMRY